MTDRGQTIAIVGAGPVGSILVANIVATGREVLVVEANEERCRQLESQGIRIAGAQTLSIKPLRVLRSVDGLHNEELSALFICTKTWTLKSLLPGLSKVVSPDTVVISFQNGIGPEDVVAEVFPRENVGRGVVNYAGGIGEDGTVHMDWFVPPNYLGPLAGEGIARLEHLAASWSRAGFHTECVPNSEIRKQAFLKTILNSAFSPLCATTGITLLKAVTYAHTRRLGRLLIREGLSVAAALGYDYGKDAEDVCMRYLDQDSDHLPSMAVDVGRGLPTEIEYINGKIAEIGSTCRNVSVDANLFFTALIVAHEIRCGVRDPSDIPPYLL